MTTSPAAAARRRIRRPRSRLLSATLGTVALNTGSVALNFAVVLLLSRTLGATSYGAYASAFAWAGILAVVAVLGLTPLVIRHVAGYSHTGSWGLLRGLLLRANQAVGSASAVVVAGGAIAGFLIYRGRPQLLDAYLVGLALVPLIALTGVRQAAMQGLGRVVIGRLPETVLVPLAFIVLAAGGDVLLGSRFTPATAIGLQALATLAGFVLGVWLLRRALPRESLAAQPVYDTGSWRRSAFPLLAMNIVMAANAQVGTIMLGAMSDAKAAGIFNVAFRVTIFISFILLAASYPLSPSVARLNAAGDRARIERTVVRAARLVLLASVPVAAVLLGFAGPILSIFGPGFASGASAVRIMAAGDLVNVLTGYGGLVLVMSGREADLGRSVLVGAVLNIGLAAALIPPFGINGAAVATAVSLSVSNIAMTWLAWRRLGVWAAVIPVGRFSLKTD